MTTTVDVAALLDRLVRDVPDFPEPGVVFKDITPLLADHDGFTAVIETGSQSTRMGRLIFLSATR